MKNEAEQSADELNPQQVADYLRQHPDFFLQQDDLLAAMELPHNSGPAVSLVERQVGVLRERNINMRHRLSSLVQLAKENDQLLEKTQALVIALLEAEQLDQLVGAVNRSLEDDFKAYVSELTLFAQPNDVWQSRVISLADAQNQIGGIISAGKTVCGVLRPEELEFLFPRHYKQVGSAAVAPLGASNPMGILAIGSRDPDYYRSSMGTVFLTYVSEVLIRVLPRFLPSPAIGD